MTDDNNYNHSDDNDHEWSRIRILMLRNVKFLSEIKRLWNGWRIFKFYCHEIKAIDVYSNMTTSRKKFGKASLISFVISIMHLFRCAVSLKCSVSRKWKKDHLPPRIFDKWWKWKDGISANARFSFSISLQSSNYWKMTCCSLDSSSSKNMIHHGGCPLPWERQFFISRPGQVVGDLKGKWNGRE